MRTRLRKPLPPLPSWTWKISQQVLLIAKYVLVDGSLFFTSQKCPNVLLGMTGGPVTCCDIKLVNWEEGNYRVDNWPCNPRGEIHVGGNNVAMGYYKLPEKTMEDFYLDEMGVRWFRTGDIGEMNPQGHLKVID